MKNLFLDDERMPIAAYTAALSNCNPVYVEKEWDIVRSYEEFAEYLNANGIPDMVSFDHDLGPTIMTGFQCAKLLIDLCESNNVDLPQCLVHSANPVGRYNIKFILDSYTRFRKKTLNNV